MAQCQIENGVCEDASKDKDVSTILVKEQENRRQSILLVGKCQVRETGNAATLHRLRSHVESDGYDCVMLDPEVARDQELTTTLQDLISCRNIISAVGLHLYGSASILLTCKELGVPYICYFGGTDINENVKTPEKLQVMTQVVCAARHLIAFTNDMKNTALNVWPSLNQDFINVLPQAITVNPNKEFDFQVYIKSLEDTFRDPGVNLTSDGENVHLNGQGVQTATSASVLENNNSYTSNQDRIENETDLSERKRVLNGGLMKNTLLAPKSSNIISSCPSCTALFSSRAEGNHHQLTDEYYPMVVLVAGQRPVKDVMFVADVWSKWHQERGSKGRFLIIGPVLDERYAKEVQTHANRLSGVLVADKLRPSDCQEIIRTASVLINTSLSEGMSAAILEAMALGTPVLARDIPGNGAIISHGVNGLLFTHPDNFLKQLQRLLHEPELSHTLTTNAKEYLHNHHCADAERKGFMKVLHDAVAL